LLVVGWWLVAVVDCFLLKVKPKQEAKAKEAEHKQKGSQGSHMEVKRKAKRVVN